MIGPDVRSDAPWRPRSAGDAAIRVAFTFGVAQPAALLLLAVVFGRALPFAAVGAWVAYAVTALLAGASVGMLWFHAQRQPAGTWRREWALSSLGMVGFSLMVNSPNLPGWSLPTWVVASTVGSALIGAVIAGFGRLYGSRSGV